MMLVKCSKCKKKYERFNIGEYGFPYLCKKCKKKFGLLSILMFSIILISLQLISAQSDQIFKQGDSIDLKIQCIINGTFCSNAANCNTTIAYPSGSLLVNNKQMTNQHSFYNYTLGDSSILGYYLCSATCCDGSYCGTDSCNFQITPTGDSNNLGFYIMLSVTFLIILGVGIFTKSIPLSLIGGMLNMGWGVYIYANGFDVFKNTATDLLSIGWIALGAIWIGLAGMEYFDLF